MTLSLGGKHVRKNSKTGQRARNDTTLSGETYSGGRAGVGGTRNWLKLPSHSVDES